MSVLESGAAIWHILYRNTSMVAAVGLSATSWTFSRTLRIVQRDMDHGSQGRCPGSPVTLAQAQAWAAAGIQGGDPLQTQAQAATNAGAGLAASWPKS